MAPTGRHFVLLIAYALCSIRVAGVPKVNLEPPKAKVLLNEEVNFTCKGTGDVLQWQVNGTELDNDTMTKRNITVTYISTVPGNLSSILTMTALPMNDGIGIGCQMIKRNTHELKVNSSILIVLGISQVTGISYDPVTSILSWSGPSFHSKDIPQTADTTYTVEVNGAVVEKNTTDTHVNIHRSCYLHFRIKACTAQYCSVASKTERGYIIQDLKIERNEDGSFTITCVYALQKAGLGCRVVVTNINSGGNQRFDILLPKNSATILLNSGIYSVTVLELINGSISAQSCVPSKQINVTHSSYTNSDNVNTKGVSISSTTAIAPATSLASAPRTATSAPASTPPIITTAITPATISTALTSTADPSITSPRITAKITAAILCAVFFVVAFVVVVIAIAFYVCYKKTKLCSAEKDPTDQVNNTSDQSTRHLWCVVSPPMGRFQSAEMAGPF